jgi:hypothetical protein
MQRRIFMGCNAVDVFLGESHLHGTRSRDFQQSHLDEECANF